MKSLSGRVLISQDRALQAIFTAFAEGWMDISPSRERAKGKGTWDMVTSTGTGMQSPSQCQLTAYIWELEDTTTGLLLLLSYQGGGATRATEALHNQQLHFCKLGVQVWMHLSGNSAPPLRNCFLCLDINFSFTPSKGGIFIYWSLEQFLHYVCHCSAKINLVFDYW